ncbi:MAG TPA: acyltransferase [Nocardioides sp.]|nr:acyltransferase [Nocardioides sp.]
MTRTGRFDYLDGIRAVAIAAVLALHWASWYVPVFHGGSVGVDVFFVLSGFIITTMLWRTPTGWVPFLRRRVVRLYPALLGLVLGALVLYAVVPWAPDSPGEVARHGALVVTQTTSVWAAGQSGSLWLPGLEPFGQTWSLAVEWYFYLLWPLAVVAARRRGWTAHRLAVVCGVVAAAAYLVSLPLGTFPFYFGPSARFGELLAGAALALAQQHAGRPQPGRHATTASIVALAAIAAYAALGPSGHSPLYRYVGVPVAVAGAVVLIHTGYGASAGPVHRLLAHPWLAAVGRSSYSLYLWHVVPFLLLADAPAPKPVLGLVAVASAVALTWLSYRVLERPFLRARSDVLAPRATAGPDVRPRPAPRA